MSAGTFDPVQHELDRALTVWRSMPHRLEAWNDPSVWDDESKMAELLNWPVEENRLRFLREARAAGRMTPDQLRLMEEMEALVARWGPEWEKILHSPTL